jgi:hypothetical protein
MKPPSSPKKYKTTMTPKPPSMKPKNWSPPYWTTEDLLSYKPTNKYLFKFKNTSKNQKPKIDLNSTNPYSLYWPLSPLEPKKLIKKLLLKSLTYAIKFWTTSPTPELLKLPLNKPELINTKLILLLWTLTLRKPTTISIKLLP